MSGGGAKTQATRAQMELREQILDGRLPAGQRLLEVPLAEALNISRTPVRDALARLAEEGLLDRAPGGGFVVRSFTFADVADAVELRGVLEGMAARLAAERGPDPVLLEEMRIVTEAMDDAVGMDAKSLNFETYSELNQRFHALLWLLSGSTVLQRELERASRLPFASPTSFLHQANADDDFARSLFTAQGQHRLIVAAIAGREGTRAEALAREHARLALANMHYATAGGSLAAGPSGLGMVVR